MSPSTPDRTRDKAKPIRFGFVVHPLSLFQKRLLSVRSLDASLLIRGSSNRRPARTISHLNMGTIRGRRLEGVLVSIPLLPNEMLKDQANGVSAVLDGIDICHQFGASVVGLGAVAAMIGGQGKVISEASPLPVTTGNCLTTYTAAQTVELALETAEGQRNIALIGPPGPVANGLMHILCERGHNVLVYSPKAPRPLRRAADKINAQGYGQVSFTEALNEALGPQFVTVAASSTGGRIRLKQCMPGSLIIDVAAPSDVIHDTSRTDVLVIDGELLRPPSYLRGGIWRTVYGLVTGQTRSIFACFAEPMLLAIANDTIGSVGRHVSTDAIREIGSLAHREGYLVDGFHRHGQPFTESKLAAFLEANGSRV